MKKVEIVVSGRGGVAGARASLGVRVNHQSSMFVGVSRKQEQCLPSTDTLRSQHVPFPCLKGKKINRVSARNRLVKKKEEKNKETTLL
jgi:hypothetical protein